jgi:radical SAM superfamily enzyme YgiQ (UPF0313 family)
MKILFIAYDNDSHIAYFPVGIAYLASACRNAGHAVTIYHQDVMHYGEEHLAAYLSKNAFDVIGLGACGGYYQYRKIKSIAEAIKASGNPALVVLGGHLVSAEPEYFLRKFQCDVICIGEGEATVVDLLNRKSEVKDAEAAGNEWLCGVKGIAFVGGDDKYVRTEQRPLTEDIDRIPMPAYDLFPMDHYALYRFPNISRSERSMPVLSGRGCTFKCNFCYRMDKGFRPRSAENILEEIRHLHETYRITYFCFADELLMSSVERTTELCKRFIESGLEFRWSCNGRLNYAKRDVLEIMKESGCAFINYGIESVDDNALKNMGKALTVEQIVCGVENTLAVGISPGLNIIFGNIGEDFDCLKKDVEFLLKYDDHSQLRTIRPVTPYPGSPLYDYAIERGMLDGIEDFYERKHVNSDLLTVNFTEMSDAAYYEALHWANEVLLNNYVEHQQSANMKIINDLYHNRDVGFRGFRPV